MDFKEKVFRAISNMPTGKITTYKEIACALGNPGLARAVGNALNKNPDPTNIPCYKVIRSDGSLGGFNRGQKEKTRMLLKEGIKVRDGKVLCYKDLIYKPGA